MIGNEIELTTEGELDKHNWSCDLTFTIPYNHWTQRYEGEGNGRMIITIEQLSKSDLIKLRNEIDELFPK